MTMTDPISDMLTRIRNANVAMHDEVSMPSSKQTTSVSPSENCTLSALSPCSQNPTSFGHWASTALIRIRWILSSSPFAK